MGNPGAYKRELGEQTDWWPLISPKGPCSYTVYIYIYICILGFRV